MVEISKFSKKGRISKWRFVQKWSYICFSRLRWSCRTFFFIL